MTIFLMILKKPLSFFLINLSLLGPPLRTETITERISVTRTQMKKLVTPKLEKNFPKCTLKLYE